MDPKTIIPHGLDDYCALGFKVPLKKFPEDEAKCLTKLLIIEKLWCCVGERV